MKRSLFRGKSTRTKLFTVITVLLVLTLLAVNLIVTYFGDLRLWQIDLTPEGFYGMSDLMEDTVEGIVTAKDSDGNKRLKHPVKITFCTDPDVLQGSMDLRMKECDTVFFLDFPVEVCLDGIKERRGKPRSDIAWKNTLEDDDEEFVEFIKSYNTEHRPHVLELLAKYSDKNIIIFKSRKEADDYLAAN